MHVGSTQLLLMRQAAKDAQMQACQCQLPDLTVTCCTCCIRSICGVLQCMQGSSRTFLPALLRILYCVPPLSLITRSMVSQSPYVWCW